MVVVVVVVTKNFKTEYEIWTYALQIPKLTNTPIDNSRLRPVIICFTLLITYYDRLMKFEKFENTVLQSLLTVSNKY